MLNPIFSLFPILGVVGIGVSAPIIYEKAAANNYQTAWNKQLEQSSYLLGSCEKQINDQKYEIKLYLSSDENGGYDRGLGLTVFVTANGGEKLFGGWSLKAESGGKALLYISPQIVNFEESHDYWNDFKDSCPMENIIAPKESSYELQSYDINFECKEAAYSFGKKECDVKFSKENKFTFKDNLKPKLKFWAF